jgi:hypothetical protein
MASAAEEEASEATGLTSETSKSVLQKLQV